jgi:regulatory subunit for Cdc7p protein kinase
LARDFAPMFMFATNKRPLSPDGGETIYGSSKRVKSQASVLKVATPNTNKRDITERRDKLRQKEERQQAKEEFIAKYTKAFPSFVFYFDERDGNIRQLAESRVLTLGAVCSSLFAHYPLC